jgi:hypothetical protein
MSYGTVTAAKDASDLAASGLSPATSRLAPSNASDPITTPRHERLRARLMLLALLSLTVAFWAAVIGLAVKV